MLLLNLYQLPHTYQHFIHQPITLPLKAILKLQLYRPPLIRVFEIQ